MPLTYEALRKQVLEIEKQYQPSSSIWGFFSATPAQRNEQVKRLLNTVGTLEKLKKEGYIGYYENRLNLLLAAYHLSLTEIKESYGGNIIYNGKYQSRLYELLVSHLVDDELPETKEISLEQLKLGEHLKSYETFTKKLENVLFDFGPYEDVIKGLNIPGLTLASN